MTTQNPTRVLTNIAEKSILVARDFKAPLPKVWRAYSESEFLDQWWAPKPWRAETKHMNFVAGGYWLYAMVGPNNERHWGRMNYLAIEHHRRISLEDAFCDEFGHVDKALPISRGEIVFTETLSGTHVDFQMKYSSAEELQQIVAMGFEQGITACLEQLAQVLETKGV